MVASILRLGLISNLLSCSLFLLGYDTLAQSTQTIRLSIGDSTVSLIKLNHDEVDPVLYLNVHENEATSVQAMQEFARTHLINYAYLTHDGKRRISASTAGKQFHFDPNRMFTRKGRKNTLNDGDCNFWRARRQLKWFATEFLEHISVSGTLVAMHNNTPDNYSILSYLPDGGESENTAEVYVNPLMDPDDFIYTTNKGIYDKLVTQEINVILQDNAHFVNDGSLSIYCGIHNITYVNIETEHGHLKEQLRLIEIIDTIVK